MSSRMDGVDIQDYYIEYNTIKEIIAVDFLFDSIEDKQFLAAAYFKVIFCDDSSEEFTYEWGDYIKIREWDDAEGPYSKFLLAREAGIRAQVEAENDFDKITSGYHWWLILEGYDQEDVNPPKTKSNNRKHPLPITKNPYENWTKIYEVTSL